MKIKMLALGLTLISNIALAGEITAINEADSIASAAQTVFSVSQVSPILKTVAGVKYKIAVVDYGPGSMAPSNLIVYVSGKKSDLGGEAGYEKSYYVENGISSVQSFSVVKNDVVLKVNVVNPNNLKIVQKTVKMSYSKDTQKLTVTDPK